MPTSPTSRFSLAHPRKASVTNGNVNGLRAIADFCFRPPPLHFGATSDSIEMGFDARRRQDGGQDGAPRVALPIARLFFRLFFGEAGDGAQ
jgi:hypothetical protein